MTKTPFQTLETSFENLNVNDAIEERHVVER
jgi:hypothetical protein